MTVLIDNDSPLLRLPNRLLPSQRVWLDHIAVSAGALELAYRAIRADLDAIAELNRDQLHGLEGARVVAGVWSLLDHSFRLAVLLVDGVPNEMRQNLTGPAADGWKAFKDARKPVAAYLATSRVVRNAYQHPENIGRRKRLAEGPYTAWGEVRWLKPHSLDAADLCRLFLGTMGAELQPEFSTPVGTFTGPVDNVELVHEGSVVNFSEFIRDARPVVELLEASVASTREAEQLTDAPRFLRLKARAYFREQSDS